MMMDEKMKVEVKVGTPAMIKPSSPTPHHKRFVQLSLLDQLKFPVHIKIVVFYPPPPPAAAAAAAEINPRLSLTTSLSQVLTQFYPYAGRFKDNSCIECTDDGVVYTEAELDSCTVEAAISKSKGGYSTGIWDHLLPGADHLDGVALDAIPLLIQANFFKCGGLALGLAASHRIMDACALSTFICTWATTASISTGTTSTTSTASVDFTISSSVYPPNHLLNDMPPTPPPQLPTAENICVTKRYVFEGTSIDALKSKLGTTPPPTRVEAVSALIWKCVIMMKTSSGDACSNNNHLCIQMINTRRRWQPPLPDNTPGNHISHFSARKNIDCTKIDKHELLRDLVYRLKDGLREFCDNSMKKLRESIPTIRSANIFEDRMAKMNRDHKSSSAPFAIMISSWCGFQLYNADFGWGKPEWIGLRPSSTNLIQLMDTKEGNGIEAWVTLSEPHMAAFEQDQDLLLFAS